MGWSGFAENSWDWLYDLYKKAKDSGKPTTKTLDIGGWKYDITMDPQMNDEGHPDACGFQVAKHSNSNQKRRLIMKSWSCPSAVYRC